MRKTLHQHRIEDFMRLAGQELPSKPTIPSLEVRRLRAKLILEEAFETIEKGLGLSVLDTGTRMTIIPDELTLVQTSDPDLEQIADGCADLSVVTIGTLSACGISDSELLEEVDASNLRKFEEGGYRRGDGKWMKPPHWKPPAIDRVLFDQGLRT